MMIKNFSQYLIEEEREVYFTFGRMNPPTIGHGKVMDTLAQKSGKSDYKVYLSQSTNPKKDPLSYTDKIKHVRKMFPKHARQVILAKDVKNVFDVAKTLYDQGYTKVNMVVGADRITEFETLLNKYNGVQARHGFYNFKKINVISAGERDPDATGIEGMSASKQRENAAKNDFVTFAQGVPKSMSNLDARKLFNDVRKGMGLKEEREFKNHIELEPVSETRERYVSGNLYNVGDIVVVKETGNLTEVTHLGANYVITETNGIKTRRWLDSVELLERQDPDIKDREGTQPARYHTGLKKSTKIARDAHFKKQSAKDDDDESAYKPAPGDATAKTKPSKYTKAFKDMYEEVSQKQLNDLEKFADRLLAKFDIDVEFTRHFADRMNDKRNNPSISISELQRLFKKIAKEKGLNIKKHKNGEAVLKDIQTDLNLPVVVNFKNDEFEVVNKTIMRKKDFKTTSPVVKYESVNEEVELTFEDIFSNPDRSFETTPQMISRWMSKTVKKNQYQQVADYIKKQRKVNSKHTIEWDAAEIIRKFNLKGIDPHALARIVREETDPVKIARDAIEREKETDKKKHDRILDRARLARAAQKNRETK